jgi:hypothetical protein
MIRHQLKICDGLAEKQPASWSRLQFMLVYNKKRLLFGHHGSADNVNVCVICCLAAIYAKLIYNK